MGLDINYFEKVERIEEVDHEETDAAWDAGDESLWTFYANEDLPGRSDGLTSGNYRVSGERGGIRRRERARIQRMA